MARAKKVSSGCIRADIYEQKFDFRLALVRAGSFAVVKAQTEQCCCGSRFKSRCLAPMGTGYAHA